MKAKIELVDSKAVKAFTEAVRTVPCDVRLTGKDENGADWNLSAKSLLCSLVVEKKMQDREHTAHDVDWNTLWVECEQDIYTLIKDFVVTGDTESIVA